MRAQVSTGNGRWGLWANSWQLLLHPASLHSPQGPGPPFICLVKRPIEIHLSPPRFTALVFNSLGCLPYLRSSPVHVWPLAPG